MSPISQTEAITDIRQDFLEGEEPPEDLMEYTNWARRAVIGSLETVHDTLTRLVTLSVALMGGATVLLNQLPVARLTRVIVMLLFFAALASSLWGSLPWKIDLNPAFPLDVKARQELISHTGMRWVRITVGCIFCAFAVLVGNLIATW